MIREVDLDEISDGRRYHANDLVKVGCRECEGCSNCCRDMDKSIILDPYDLNLICSGTGKSFDELLTGEKQLIELSMQNGVTLPNIKMQQDTNACGFLNDEGRCSIHPYRSGFCRMFPLGRVYEEGHFDYFLQVYECDYPNKSKVKVKKWLGIENLAAYEKFVLKWHDFLEEFRSQLGELAPNDCANAIVNFLKTFYRMPYSCENSFFEQINQRMENFKMTE